MNPSNDDCYFYYYSTCAKGTDCPYRHCELALGTETVCSKWKEGLCLRSNCKFRHMESRINRKAIPCYWENQPGGCRKPHCVFLHQKKNATTNAKAENTKLIFPTVSTPDIHSPPLKSTLDAAKPPVWKEGAENVELSPTSVPVEPVVVSLNDGEESDTESVHTPSKMPRSTIGSSLDKTSYKNSDGDDFGVKTLEQLRMEKIHRESEHFYKSVYDAPSLENVPDQFKGSNLTYERESYISDGGVSHDDILNSNDLRSILKRKSIAKPLFEPNNAAEVPRKRVISLKRIKGNDEDSSVHKKIKNDSIGSLDFEIKTLAEIKKAKNKTGDERKGTSVMQDRKRKSEISQSSYTMLKNRVKRPALEIYCVKSSSRNGNSHSTSHNAESKKTKLDDSNTDASNVKNTELGKWEKSEVHLKSAPNVRSAVSWSKNLSGFLSFVRSPNSSKVSNSKKELKSVVSNQDNKKEELTTKSESNSNKDSANDIASAENAKLSIVDATSNEEDLTKEDFSETKSSSVDITLDDESSMKEDSIETATKKVVNNPPLSAGLTRRISETDFDELLLDDEEDITLDAGDGLESDGDKTGDIYLELEEMLKS